MPLPFHNFFPKFVKNYVLTKMPYLYFLLISALQVRTTCMTPDPAAPAFL
jgi:hypothetical protein